MTWLVTSRLGDHNDLAWRAVLPAVLALIVAAAVGLTRWISQRAYGAAFAAIAALILALPEGIDLAIRNATGHASGSAAALAHAPALWTAVRAHTAADERVANNPLYLADATPWPVNISWALLANRRSCFAGRELALAYVPCRMRAAKRSMRSSSGSSAAKGRPKTRARLPPDTVAA